MEKPEGKPCISVAEEDVVAFLAAAPVLDSRLPKIEARILAYFGPEARLERQIFSPRDEEDAVDQFHLRVVTDMDLDQRIDRLRAVLRDERELLTPVRPPLTIGIL
ncbi:MAG TPA: hypothetical protein VGC32_21385 [Solirubrobacterales bacterium]